MSDFEQEGNHGTVVRSEVTGLVLGHLVEMKEKRVLVSYRFITTMV